MDDTGLINQPVQALVLSGGHLLAGTGLSGLYRSSDGGAVWKQSIEGAYLFAGAVGGLFRSEDNGLHWSEPSANLAKVATNSIAFL